jgi:ABC-type multidrug transport system permease subunit
MKLGLTIKKNIKMLMRSRVSTIVLVLGPLLVIMLVGLSFSSNTFSLKMGVYSESYSDLSREFISKLNEDGFSITQMETEEICINSVKEQQMHTCIIFPEDMSLDNEKTNLISFYVDQSQINLVYLVMSSLEGSFEEVTTGISKDLTDEIVSSLFLTKAGLLDSKEILTPLIDKNSLIIRTATDSSTSLGNLDLDTKGADASVSTKSIEDKLDSLLKNSGDLIDDTILLLDGFRNDGNISNYARGIIRSDLLELEDLIINAHNFSIKELGEISEKLSSSLEALSSKLNNAKDVNSAVITKINLIKENADDIKENSELLNLMIDGMVGRINNIQITNIENIVSPITTEIIPIAQSESNLSYIFPSLIVILIMFIGLLLPSTLIIMEKNSRAHFRIFTTPTKPWLHIVATYLTSLIILILQVFIILAVSQLYFKISFLSSFWMLMLSMFVIMSLFIMMGMLLGYLFNTEEMSMLASVSLATLLLLTSGIVFPIESMPSYIIEKIKI